MDLTGFDYLRLPYKDELPMNIDDSGAEPDRNTARLERQIARAEQALAQVEVGYYITDGELDTNPGAGKVRRQPIDAQWV
ncbi:hypothetical protein NUV26_30160 [Burkholderia pseudomultivorans]|uniref:hypothetical protein n=1 Tax=Burkholderia pseudomultivorans TaxID=1207504 RepID=UPI00287511BF|nr:hypothetical protein [Burkholderia pseudomultivorans]MDS0796443.1 hypothetical protein [Burkholderia pseudomultivorans]